VLGREMVFSFSRLIEWRREEMNIPLNFFVKTDAVTTDIELASFSYGVGRILRRSRRGSMRRGRGERVES
jgi:hypothetical protein